MRHLRGKDILFQNLKANWTGSKEQELYLIVLIKIVARDNSEVLDIGREISCSRTPSFIQFMVETCP